MMKNYMINKFSIVLLAIAVVFTGCSKDDPALDLEEKEQQIITVKDLNGLDKGGVYFSLEKNIEVEEDSKEWDISISGTTISFGNGASGQLVEGILGTYHTATLDGYNQTAITGSGSYYINTLYNEPQHAILMKPGVLILVKTTKGNFVKMEMISYYKGNPDITTADFADIPTRGEKWPKQHYTFNYVLQSDGTNKF